MESTDIFHHVSSVPPDDRDYYNVHHDNSDYYNVNIADQGIPPDNRDYYNVNVADQGNYGKLSPANDIHTYVQVNKTTGQ